MPRHLSPLRFVSICVAAAFLAFAAQAIEPSQTVKVTQLLKATQTWNGVPIKYPDGQAEVTSLMIAEVIATAHNGRNVGTTPLKLIVFYAGAVDKQPLSVPRPDAKPKTN
jgi:hypothetical protein